MERKLNEILKIVAEAREPIGSSEISEKLKELGIDMPERTVRYHLKNLSDKGLLKVHWKEGRMITKKGMEEINDAFAYDKVGLVSSRIEAMSYQMGFDLDKKAGNIILNISFFHKSDFKEALSVMREVFTRGLSMGELVFVAQAGEVIGKFKVPTGRVVFGTLCAFNLNAILFKQGIPVESKFGGVLQMENNKPLRFTDLVSYSGSTLDPHEIFIKGKMTSVREAAKGSGKILAGMREIPAVSAKAAEQVLKQAEEAGFGKALLVGKPSQPVLGVPVGVERVGIVVPGGLNPVAACEEWGIETESKALVTMVDYSRLQKFASIA